MHSSTFARGLCRRSHSAVPVSLAPSMGSVRCYSHGHSASAVKDKTHEERARTGAWRTPYTRLRAESVNGASGQQQPLPHTVVSGAASPEQTTPPAARATDEQVRTDLDGNAIIVSGIDDVCFHIWVFS